MLSFFPRGVSDEILNLIESVSEEFPSYSLSRYRSAVGRSDGKCSARRSCRGREFKSRTGKKYFSAFTGIVDLLYLFIHKHTQTYTRNVCSTYKNKYNKYIKINKYDFTIRISYQSVSLCITDHQRIHLKLCSVTVRDLTFLAPF